MDIVRLKKETSPFTTGLGQDERVCQIDFYTNVVTSRCPTAMNSDGTSNKEGMCTYCPFRDKQRGLTGVRLPLSNEDYDEYMIKFLADNPQVLQAHKGKWVLRVGKIFDTWAPFYPNECKKTLLRQIDWFYTTNIISGPRIMIPDSKMLPFDLDLAKSFKDRAMRIQYSLGIDDLEPGACKWVCTNDWRIEQGLQYISAGVNVEFRIIMEASQPPMKYYTDLIAKIGKAPVLNTILYYTSSAPFEYINQGYSWEKAIKNEYPEWTYEKQRLMPNFLHPDWSRTNFYCGVILQMDRVRKFGCSGCGEFKKQVWSIK